MTVIWMKRAVAVLAGSTVLAAMAGASALDVTNGAYQVTGFDPGTSFTLSVDAASEAIVGDAYFDNESEDPVAATFQDMTAQITFNNSMTGYGTFQIWTGPNGTGRQLDGTMGTPVDPFTWTLDPTHTHVAFNGDAAFTFTNVVGLPPLVGPQHNGVVYGQIDLVNGTGGFLDGSMEVTANTVPEPVTVGLGVAGLVLALRRRRAAKR